VTTVTIIVMIISAVINMKILSLVGRNFHKLHDDKNDSATRVFPAKPR